MTRRNKIFAISFAILLLSASYMAVVFFRNPQPQVVQIACLGDSITEITMYPAYLQYLLGNSCNVENFGVSGATVLMNSDRPYLNQPEFLNATRFEPDIAVILLGTNDASNKFYSSIENFEKTYINLIRKVQLLDSRPIIFLVTPPPLFDNKFDLNSTYLNDGVLPRVQELASRLNVPLIDIYSPLVNHPEYFPDGVHPNEQGALVIAKTVYSSISLSVSLRQELFS